MDSIYVGRCLVTKHHSLYFMFIGSKNSGMSNGLVKMIINYEEETIKDSKDNISEIRTILFCPTGNSE
jgi:hypothetical protein